MSFIEDVGIGWPQAIIIAIILTMIGFMIFGRVKTGPDMVEDFLASIKLMSLGG